MADISMCPIDIHEKCQKAKTCYRAQATPSSLQSYIRPNPETCERYWSMEQKPHSRSEMRRQEVMRKK